MTEDDAVGPGTSLAEDLLELRLLTAEDKGLGPIDFPVKDHQFGDGDLQIDEQR
jgi:hypothetical protein